MTGLNIFVPLTKIDVEKRLVYGVATAEVPDRTNEICDYASTKPLYEKWSNDFHKATEGKSLGNLRAMHGNVAAGKVTSIAFNDDAKSIEICAKVIDDNEWNKVVEGVYTGFSQGGAYVKRWQDEGSDHTRYTADPSEISLVDLPCLATATFQIVKADGIVVEQHFKEPELEAVIIEPEFETKLVSKIDGSSHNTVDELKTHHIKLEADKLANEAAAEALALVGSINKTLGVEPTNVEKLEASVEELSKMGARNSKTDKQRIQAVHDHACALGADCPDDDGDDDSDNDSADKSLHAAALQKSADELTLVKEQLAKALALVASKEDIITKQFLPVLQKMQESIAALEAQPMPLPWQVGTKVISKTGDVGTAHTEETFEQKFEKMTPEERSLELTKLSLRNPLTLR